MRWLVNIAKIQQRLLTEDFEVGKTSEFVIHERGKVRLIEGNTIEDRIIFHVVCDDFLTPAIQPYILYTNGASQVGKGLDFQRKLLRKHLHQYYLRNRTNKGWILISDFSKFYDNIDVVEAWNQFARLIDNRLAMGILWRTFYSMKVDTSYYEKYGYPFVPFKHDSLYYYTHVPKSEQTGEYYALVGVYIGAQPSQVVGIFYPTEFDTCAPCKYGIKESARYQDDSYAMSNSKEQLEALAEDELDICTSLGIFVNNKKTHIYRLDKGFKFLQHNYRLLDNGVVVDKINKKQVHKFRRRLKSLAEKVNSGDRTFDEISNSIYSWVIAFHKYMSKLQIDNLVLLICSLFPDEVISWKQSHNLIQLATPSRRKLIKQQFHLSY